MIGDCFSFPENPNVYLFLGYDFTDFRYVFISVSGVIVRVKAIAWDIVMSTTEHERIAA